ncbi:MAG: bile acid:sodium symporter family protein [Sphingomonas sp.]
MARPLKILLSVDRFLLWLIAVVVAASLLPVRGWAASWTDVVADLAIALLFFLHGAKLSRAAIVQGMGNWRLHALTLGSTYVLFPAIGLALVWIATGWVNPLLLSGLLYLTLLPSTVQSSIAFTAMAGGNVAAAVCSASLSNLAGIFLTPVLVGIFMKTGGTGAVSSSHSVQAIALQLLLPFLAGHFLRPLIGSFIDRNKAILQPVDRGSILIVVYSAFSAAVINGIWTRVNGSDLMVLLVLSAVILALILGTTALVARLLGMPREDAIVLQFCGSKKSLVSGVPMAGALFPPAQVGLIVLPLMIFHQLQLFVCAGLAGRYHRQAVQRAAAAAQAADFIPRTEDEIADAAAKQGFAVPDACMPGVAANLDLLGHHAEILLGKEQAAQS